MIEDNAAVGRWPLTLAFSCFAAQGIANSMLGVAWPSMRSTFGIPLNTLIALLISSTVGYVLGSLLSGRMMARIGIGRSLLIGNLLAAAGFLGYALAPAWWLMVILAALVGWTSGIIGASLNIYVAATRTVRSMNWMHAMYGVGATIGPLLMAAAIGFQAGWRLGYVVAAIVHLALGLLFLRFADQMRFQGVVNSKDGQRSRKAAPPSVTIRVPIVVLGIFLFMLYTGVETTAGQWSYSLFTEERAMSLYVAGVSTSLYWGMLTAGRVIFGAIAGRVGITRLLRFSMVGVVISAGLLLIPTPEAGISALAMMGLSLSAIFPTLMSDTPNRVSSEHLSSTIGFQTGAASIGIAILPGLAGVLADRLGLEVIGIILLFAATLMLITNEFANFIVRRNRLGAEQLAGSAK